MIEPSEERAEELYKETYSGDIVPEYLRDIVKRIFVNAYMQGATEGIRWTGRYLKNKETD